MSELFEYQTSFPLYLAQLYVHANSLGYRVTLGDAYRDERAFGKPGETGCAGYGHPTSNHKYRLAQDVNLFRATDHGWVYITDSTGHTELGEFWEALAPECRWGGRWNDFNHYEINYRER